MRLGELVKDVRDARIAGDPATEVRGVVDDSRRVEPGDVFVAVRGLTVDGHDFVPAAVARGAAAVVVERPVDASVPQVLVRSGARALGWLAARAAGRPADAMTLVGVTGTNGKTTTTWLVEAILAAAGASPGVVGTVSNRWGGRTVAASYTTPTPLVLQELLASMRADATTHVVMEATSAALAMDRLEGLTFRVAAFSNLTQDHLDVHGTMAAYEEAKGRLFTERLAADGVAVAMIDDPAAERMLARAPAGARRIRVSIRREADVWVRAAESTIDGIVAIFSTPRGDLAVRARALVGEYNLANLVLAVGIAEALGLPRAAIVRGIEGMAGVPGRVEPVDAAASPFRVVVDYAHTPDALERVIAALRPLTRGRLLVVFGCGGDRDPTKRPLMGGIVAREADVAIVTSDNPRTEDPSAIIGMILPGVRDAGARELTPAELTAARRGYVVEPDRRRAIQLAIGAAGEGDVVLVAGKGHEDYQILGRHKIHFDDREEARAAIAARAPFLTLDEVLHATHGEVVAAGATSFAGLGIDGRAIGAGELYVAIRGERFDGHDFCAQAAGRGATGFLVARGRGAAIAAAVGTGATVVEVDHPQAAIGAVAGHVRRRWGGPLVAVTGSTGKTTTKQLLAAMLAAVVGEDAIVATEGSLNNETGVPLTLARLRPHHRYAVIEMGMRGLGHIEYLARMAEPDVGIVANVGLSHVGVVGSVEGIAQGKSEVWLPLRPGGVAIHPHGDGRLAAWVRERAPQARVITFGEEDGATVRVTAVEPRGAEGSDVTLAIAGRARPLAVRVPLVGRFNAVNAACALAAALALGVDLDAAARGIAAARPARQRAEVVEIGGRKVIVDCYNANPTSMRAALETLASLAAGRRAVAVLGDMLELGAIEEEEHQAVGRLVRELGIDHLVTLGERAREAARAARAAGVPEVKVANADDPDGAAGQVARWTSPGDWILVKASRGMRLERVVDALRQAVT